MIWFLGGLSLGCYGMSFLQWNHDVLKGHRTGKIIMFTTVGSHPIEVLSYIIINYCWVEN